MKGSVGTAYAVRVDDKVFATGQKEGQSVDLWLDNEGLCVDLHDPKLGERTARFILLNTTATLNGTLFNGFEKTKHADVLIVSADSEEIKKKSVSGKEYQEGGFKFLDRLTFWQTIWKN
jgi:hypothetical protein